MKYILDFITPWKNGMAQKMIKNAIKALINPITRNLVINHHGRVFELKKKAAEIARIYDLIFLIHSPTEYAVWKINDDFSLTSYDFDISQFITETSWSYWYYPSTVKSNKDYNEHYFATQKKPRKVDDPQYGMRVFWYNDGVNNYVIVGLSLHHKPVGWDVDGNYEWDLTLFDTIGDLYATSRHPFYIETDGTVIKNLEVRKTINVNTVQIEYDTKVGHQNSSSFDVNGANAVYTALSKDKLVYRSSSKQSPFDNQYYDDWVYNTAPGPCCSSSPSADRAFHREYLSIGMYKYFFGGVLLEYVYPSGTNIIWHQNVYFHSYNGCLAKKNDYITRVGIDLGMMDYDNLNGDNTFICFYWMHRNDGRNFYYIQVFGAGWGGPGGGEYEIYKDENGEGREYWLAYRINGGTLIKVRIASLVNSFFWYGHNIPCSYWITDATGTGFYGDRIRDVTCNITEKYILYSYSIQHWAGGLGTAHFDDLDDTNWTFEKRILGIIDIKTGTRTEHEVNDTLLGDLYKDVFDETAASAVGLHKLEV